MGLGVFNALVKEKAPNCFASDYLSRFRGKRIAIDGSNFSHMYMYPAVNQYMQKINILSQDINHDDIRTIFLGFVLEGLQKFLLCGVTPIVILDGKSLPEKAVTINKRRSDKNKVRNKLADLESTIDDAGIVPTPEMIKELEKYHKGLQHVTYEDYDCLKNILAGLGIPFLQAKHDAEKLCSNLCSQGYVSAVYSNDCDNYAFGCPRLITKLEAVTKNGNSNDVKITIIETSDILTGLGLSLNQLIDMFIIIGCDYGHIPTEDNNKVEDNNIGEDNKRRRNNKPTGLPDVGKKKGYDLIKIHGSIENLPNKHDLTRLNYIRCREIFAPEPITDIFISEDDNGSLPPLTIDPSIISEYGREILGQYSLDNYLTTYIMLINTLPESTGDEPYTPRMRPKFNIIKTTNNITNNNITNNNNTTNNNTTNNNITNNNIISPCKFNITNVPVRPEISINNKDNIKIKPIFNIINK